MTQKLFYFPHSRFIFHFSHHLFQPLERHLQQHPPPKKISILFTERCLPQEEKKTEHEFAFGMFVSDSAHLQTDLARHKYALTKPQLGGSFREFSGYPRWMNKDSKIFPSLTETTWISTEQNIQCTHDYCCWNERANVKAFCCAFWNFKSLHELWRIFRTRKSLRIYPTTSFYPHLFLRFSEIFTCEHTNYMLWKFHMWNFSNM